MFDAYRGKGSLSDGVKLPNGGKLRITVQKKSLTNGANGNGKTGTVTPKAMSVDNKILAEAKIIQKGDPKNDTILGLQRHQPPHQSRRHRARRLRITRRIASISRTFTPG